MKEWIQENKFLAILIGVVSFITMILGALIYMEISEQGELKALITQKSGKLKVFRNELGNPSEESKEQLVLAVREGREASEELHLKLASSGVHKLDTTRSSTDFATLLEKYVNTNKKNLSGANVKFPSNSWFGFNRYKESLIKPNNVAIGLCLYQQQAYSWFFDELASLGPCELKSFYRESLAEEEENETKKAEKFEAVRRMRFDAVVELTEAQLSTLLKNLTSGNDHFMVVRGLSLVNKSAAPIAVTSMMRGKSQEDSSDSGSKFNFENMGDSETDGGGANQVGGRDLNKKVKPSNVFMEQILGNEKIIVSLAMDLVLVTELDKLKILKGSK